MPDSDPDAKGIGIIAFLVNLTLPSNRGQAPASLLSVKSDLFGSNLIDENMKKRFIRLSESKLVKLCL